MMSAKLSAKHGSLYVHASAAGLLTRKVLCNLPNLPARLKHGTAGCSKGVSEQQCQGMAHAGMTACLRSSNVPQTASSGCPVRTHCLSLLLVS